MKNLLRFGWLAWCLLPCLVLGQAVDAPYFTRYTMEQGLVPLLFRAFHCAFVRSAASRRAISKS